MKLKISSGNPLLPFEAKTYYVPAEECTREEMVDYLANLADTKNLEMLFYTDDEITYGYFKDKEICYYLASNKKDTLKDSDESTSSTSKSNNPSVDRSSIFTKGLLILLMLFNLAMPASAETAPGINYFSGDITEEATEYPALSKAKFNTPSGATVIPGYISRATDNNYSDLAFTYFDPRRLSYISSYDMDAFPGGNADLIAALLSYRIKFTLAQVQDETGLAVSERQLTEATQLAVWLHASSQQVDYQIDANSISDPTVRTLASNITTWATKQVTNATDKGLMDYIFPVFEPRIITNNAGMETQESSVYYGPYTIESQKGTMYTYEVPGGVVVNTSKKKIDKVVVGQQFYVQFPLSYTGTKNVKLSGVQTKYELYYQVSRLWLHQTPVANTIEFKLGETTGTQGTILVRAKDQITGKPVPAVTVEISKASPQDTVLTGEDGSVTYQTEPGIYTLSFVVPQGYLKPPDQEIEIGFAGDIRTINLDLAWTQAIMNFYAVDASTLAPTGESEAFIYDSTGKAVKKIGLRDGRVTGIILPEGDYTLVQYKTSGNYALNPGVPFKAVAGQSMDVSIPQDANVMPTVMSIKGANPTDTWVYTISNQDRVLFRMNSTNKLELPLPNGAYSVKAQKSDGTSTAGPQSFKTSLNGLTKVELDTVKGEETVTFNIVDTKTKSPIPNVTVGVFDENHTLLKYATANAAGHVSIDGIVSHRIYYVNILAAPESVSGYSANGNRFLGQTKTFELQLYSQKEIKEVTEVDTLYRVPNVTYSGPSYTYPE